MRKTTNKTTRLGMRRVELSPEQEGWQTKTCGECRDGEYIDVVRSRTADGKPFMKKCGFATWGRHTSGERITLDNCKACKHFSPKV